MFCPVKGSSQPQISSSRELGLVLGLSSSLDYPLRPREHLALLGLVASPMQMVWIYDHLRNNFARACDLPPVPSPLEWLRAHTNVNCSTKSKICSVRQTSLPLWLIDLNFGLNFAITGIPEWLHGVVEDSSCSCTT